MAKIKITQIVMDNVSGMLEAFNGDKKFTKNFQTRKRNKNAGTIEVSLNGTDWETVNYFEKGKAKFDETYDPELDPNEQGKNQMVSPSGYRVIRGNV